MHNQVNDDFNILYGKSHQFTGLVNMGMVLSGLTSFTFPRDSDYNFKLSLQYPFERGVFETKTSH